MSFGHAAYLGIGGYAVGMLAHESIYSGFMQWPVALGASALFALVIGALSPAHARRLFHHDHAGLRANGLLRHLRHRALRRRRRADHRQAQPVLRAAQSVEQDAVLLRLPGAVVWRDLSGLAADQFALRHGDAGRALERTAHARHRLPDLSLPADRLRHRRHAVRAGRRAAGQPHRFRLAVDDVLDALGRPHHHGGARRHGLGRRPVDRRGRAVGAGRGAVRASPNIGRSSSGRCCCWWCCSRAAASTACLPSSATN